VKLEDLAAWQAQRALAADPWQQAVAQLLLVIQKELEVLVRIAAGAEPEEAMRQAGLQLRTQPEEGGGG